MHNKPTIKLISIIFALLMSKLFASAQSQHLFTLDDGLSSTLFKSLYIDSKGILWIGTEDGLNSFDGNKFIAYKNIPGDSTSLQNNFISTIVEDKYGRLLIGTYMGLQAHDQASGRFLNATEDGKIFHDGLNSIIQRKNGEIWCFGNRIMKLEDNPNSLSLTQVFPELRMTTRAIEDNDGNLWLSFGTKLIRISNDSTYTQYFGKIGDSRIQALTLDHNGNLYIGTNRSGLWRYDRNKDEFIHLYKMNEPMNILDFLVLDDGNIVIATDGTGLKLYDTANNSFSTYNFSNTTLDFCRLKTHQVTKDKRGNMWITIFQKGLLVLPPESNSFKYIGDKSFINNVVGSNCITSIVDDSNGNLWIGTDNDGIYLLDSELKQKKHFYGDNIPPVIMNLFKDSKENIWVGSYSNGAGIINSRTGAYTPIKLISTSDDASAENIFGFTEDKNGNIYIATMGKGMFKYNPRSGNAVHMSEIEDFVGKGCNWIASIHYSPDNDALYAGTYSGLYKIDIKDGIINVDLIIPDIIVHNIHEASDDNSLWLGTSQGLLKLNPSNNQFTTFTTENGLPSNTIYGIEDVNGNLWLSTNSGLSYFTKKDKKFINYFVNDGLQGNEFYKGAVLKSHDGTLFFGGTSGITYFDPEEIEFPGRSWNVRINDLLLHGKPVKTGTKSGNRTIIDTDIHQAESFHFAHKDNSFSIEFSTQELYRPQSVVFSYRLDNDDWTTLPYGTNTVNFSELSSGKHHLTLKAIDNGVESEERQFVIDIAHPWWDTWIAHIIFSLAILGVALFIWRHLKLKVEDRKRKMHEEHQKELNEAKLQFFINISHEIRTPLTLVMSPLKKLIETDSDPMRRKEYNIINRNANRILRLINELMDIRKIDRNQMRMSMKEIMLVPFINDLYDTFLPTAQQKNIALQFHYAGKEHIKAWVDPSNFDKILMNLISNALKYTPERGKIDIDLNEGVNPDIEGPLHNYIEITVTDTGIGIPPAEREKIFQRFYQVRNSSGGTGVGLHLTHSLVRLHHGELSVHENTDAGKGSIFRIILPQGDAHLSQDEKYESVEEAVPQLPIISEAETLTALMTESYEDNTQRSRGETILIVEDNSEIRTYLQHELSAKYKIIVCTNGKEAIELLSKNNNSIDVIISDIMMPEMDGLELTRKIKQNLNINHIPVILLTAKTRDEDLIEGLDIGADAYITKPFNINILRSKIDNLVKNNRRLRNIYNGTQSPKEHMKDIDASSGDDKLIARVMKVINKHLSDPDITVEMLAQEVGLSRVHLHRKLKELTNQSPRDFIRNVRLQQAARLLKEKHMTVAEVADLTGFKSPNNFATAFKDLYGMPPTVYMNQTAEGNKE